MKRDRKVVECIKAMKRESTFFGEQLIAGNCRKYPA
jgi:hypothetical protein